MCTAELTAAEQFSSLVLDQLMAAKGERGRREEAIQMVNVVLDCLNHCNGKDDPETLGTLLEVVVKAVVIFMAINKHPSSAASRGGEQNRSADGRGGGDDLPHRALRRR